MGYDKLMLIFMYVLIIVLALVATNEPKKCEEKTEIQQTENKAKNEKKVEQVEKEQEKEEEEKEEEEKEELQEEVKLQYRATKNEGFLPVIDFSKPEQVKLFDTKHFDNVIIRAVKKTRFGTLSLEHNWQQADYYQLFFNDKLVQDFKANDDLSHKYSEGVIYFGWDAEAQYKDEDVFFMRAGRLGSGVVFEDCGLVVVNENGAKFINVKNCRIMAERGDISANNRDYKFREIDGVLSIYLDYYDWQHHTLKYDGKKAFISSTNYTGKAKLEDDECSYFYEKRADFCHEIPICCGADGRENESYLLGYDKRGLNLLEFEKVCDKPNLAYEEFKEKACQIDFDDKNLDYKKLIQYAKKHGRGE